MSLLLCLLLLLPGAAATTALSLEGGLASPDSGHVQEAREVKKSSLLPFLAWWSLQASAAPSIPGAVREASKRQDSRPPQQSVHPVKPPCKNFFWKTFSSCK